MGCLVRASKRSGLARATTEEGEVGEEEFAVEMEDVYSKREKRIEFR